MISIYDELIGEVIIKIDKCVGDCEEEDSITFYLSNGSIYKQCHDTECSEYVHIEDIDGDLNDLIGYDLIQAEESSNKDSNALESGTWTFYKFGTSKGYVTIRWYGESNGYYSETAEMTKIEGVFPIKEIRKIKLNKLYEIKKERN